MLVGLGVMGVVAPTPDPLPGTLTLPVLTLVAVAVQLRRALVVLVVLGEVVLLLLLLLLLLVLLVEVMVMGRGGRGMNPGALVHLAVPSEPVGGDRLCSAEAAAAVVLSAPRGCCHGILDAVAPVAPRARDRTGWPAAGA